MFSRFTSWRYAEACSTHASLRILAAFGGCTPGFGLSSTPLVTGIPAFRPHILGVGIQFFVNSLGDWGSSLVHFCGDWGPTWGSHMVPSALGTRSYSSARTWAGSRCIRLTAVACCTGTIEVVIFSCTQPLSLHVGWRVSAARPASRTWDNGAVKALEGFYAACEHAVAFAVKGISKKKSGL